MTTTLYGVTGANGQLGQLVVHQFIKHGVPASSIVALVRSPSKATELAKLGVQVRKFDYNEVSEAVLASALAGVKRLLLISGSEVGKRFTQHSAVIKAAKTAKVELLGYTSLLHAASTKMVLATEHKQTEEALMSSGLRYVILRHGWYTENFFGNLHADIVLSAAPGEAKMNPATREDFAEADVVAMMGSNEKNQILEMGGDEAISYHDMAVVLSKLRGCKVGQKTVSEAELVETLTKFAKLPEPFAKVLADCDVCAGRGALADNSHTISKLIGHPTTTLEQCFAKALGK